MEAPGLGRGITCDDKKRTEIINFDMMENLKKHNSKAVKKTLSIPEWLNEEALSLRRNFSQVLQEALMQKIGIVR